MTKDRSNEVDIAEEDELWEYLAKLNRRRVESDLGKAKRPTALPAFSGSKPCR
jgi:hypothetical protein